MDELRDGWLTNVQSTPVDNELTMGCGVRHLANSDTNDVSYRIVSE